MIKNKLDRPFGPSGTFAGLVVCSAGIGIIFYSPAFGIAFMLVGAFIAFTYTIAYIDTGNKKIRFSNKLFGLIPTGKWVQVSPSMKILLRRCHRGFRTYSRSNRSLDIHQRDYRLVLTDYQGKELAELKKEKDAKAAEKSRIALLKALGIE